MANDLVGRRYPQQVPDGTWCVLTVTGPTYRETLPDGKVGRWVLPVEVAAAGLESREAAMRVVEEASQCHAH